MNDDQQQGLDPYTVINNLAEQIKSQAIQIAMFNAQINALKTQLQEAGHE